MPNKNGLILITPSSVDKTGTGSTATISANGSVSFSSCETFSLNGVFSADYVNYMIVMWTNQAVASDSDIHFRLRASGTDSTSTADYNRQLLQVNGGSITASRVTNPGFWLAGYSNQTYRNGLVGHIYAPYLAELTAYRTSAVSSSTGALLGDFCGTHDQSTSYDGLTVRLNSNSFTGRVAVYGMRK